LGSRQIFDEPVSLWSYLNFAVFFASLSTLVTTSPTPEDSTEPEISVTAAFPESNPFGHVVNGEKNSLLLNVENKSDRNVTLTGVSGSAHNPQTNRLIKNLTTSQFNVPLTQEMQLEIPYVFFSEFKPGDLRLNVWIEYSAAGVKHRTVAYDSVVTIVEPDFSIFDLKLGLTYLIVTGILGAVGYLTVLSYFPQAKKLRSKKPNTSSITSPVGTVTAIGSGGYQEEWVPEHHFRKKSKKGASATASGVSGDELSANDTSGTEGKRRKARK